MTSTKQHLIKILPLLLIIISPIATRCTSAGLDPYIVLEDVEERRILTGVFEIYGNQSYVFEDGAFILDGPFKIRGNATLRLVNASLFLGVQLAEFEPFFIEVFDEGRLECVNTTIYGNKKGFSAIGVSGQAKIILEETKMAEPPWTNYPGQVYPRLTLLGNSSLEAEASELAYVSAYHDARCTIMGARDRTLLRDPHQLRVPGFVLRGRESHTCCGRLRSTRRLRLPPAEVEVEVLVAPCPYNRSVH